SGVGVEVKASWARMCPRLPGLFAGLSHADRHEHVTEIPRNQAVARAIINSRAGFIDLLSRASKQHPGALAATGGTAEEKNDKGLKGTNYIALVAATYRQPGG